jgi:hypothetical protein
MNRYKVTLFIFIVTCFTPMMAEYSDFYGSMADLFSLFADPNTGLVTFPTLLIPVGGKLEGMGTAYTAIADDSGYMEANPAGSAGLNYEELSLFHHAWIADSNLEGILYTKRFGEMGIGFGGKFLYVPFTRYNGWGDRVASDFISESILTANISYNFFSSANFYGLMAGANVKAAYRSVPESIYPGQSALTAMVDVGVLTRLDLLKFFVSRNTNFSIGAALKNFGLPALNEPLPTLLSCGIAWSFVKPVTLAVDFNLPISLDPVNFPAERWYLAFGLNVDFVKFVSLQTGFVLKENPRISLGASINLNEVNIVANYNLDLSGSVNPADKFSVEAKIKLNYKERLSLQQKIDDLFGKGLESYGKGEFEKALAFWEATLELDPKHKLAREYIETTKKFIELQSEMEGKQLLQ